MASPRAPVMWSPGVMPGQPATGFIGKATKRTTVVLVSASQPDVLAPVESSRLESFLREFQHGICSKFYIRNLHNLNNKECLNPSQFTTFIPFRA